MNLTEEQTRTLLYALDDYKDYLQQSHESNVWRCVGDENDFYINQIKSVDELLVIIKKESLMARLFKFWR